MLSLIPKYDNLELSCYIYSIPIYNQKITPIFFKNISSDVLNIDIEYNVVVWINISKYNADTQHSTQKIFYNIFSTSTDVQYTSEASGRTFDVSGKTNQAPIITYGYTFKNIRLLADETMYIFPYIKNMQHNGAGWGYNYSTYSSDINQISFKTSINK